MSELLKPVEGNRFILAHAPIPNEMLLIDKKYCIVVMSDHEKEKILNAKIVEIAHGDVLVIGFGLGMILIPMMENPKINSITVIEKEQEVLDLVASQLPFNDKVNIVLFDALQWRTNKKFDIIWDDANYLPSEDKDIQYKIEIAKKRMISWLKPNGVFMKFDEVLKEEKWLVG